MKTKVVFACLLGLALLFSVGQPVSADGIIIIPPPPCEPGGCPPPPKPLEQVGIRYHHVDVEIVDQLATTRVDQVFTNPNETTIEGTYVFPLPLEAAVKSFILWIDGKPVEGKVLSADEARRTYEEIVNQTRDPALLEYIGRGAVQASIFPIPPGGERRIQLEYTQILTAENGLVRYAYPLNTEKFSVTPLESVSVTVNIRSSQPVRAVYSSSHQVDVNRRDDQNINISYEAANIRPDTDFNLFYSIGESEAFHLISYRDPGDLTDPDGFFMLLLAPRPGQDSAVVAKDMILVLDRSGSMEGVKFQQAQSALRYILKHLNAEDRFHLISFSSDIQTYARDLRPAKEAPEALGWVDRLSASGSTDINRALLEAAAVSDRERPTYLIFLTDGLPTEGEIESQRILSNFASSAPDNLRLFAFGVGYDVDTFLLDSLSQTHHGLSTYVQPGQALDEVLSGFYTRISTPVLTDLALDFGGMSVYDIYPQPLPDLFNGSQVVVVGRYREGGTVNVRLNGVVNDRSETFTFAEQTFVTDSRAMRGAPVDLPRLWATRKIGYLLNQMRLAGFNEELVTQVVRLGTRYGIVTPYTSYLVTEAKPLTSSELDNMIGMNFNNWGRMEAAAPVSGAGAVEKAAEQSMMAQADVAQQVSAEARQSMRVLGSRAFIFSEGKWVDTRFDADTMKITPVAFGSADYYALAASNAELAAAFALGEWVIVVQGESVYEVVAEGSQIPPVKIAPTSTSQPTALVIDNPPQVSTVKPAQKSTVQPVPSEKQTLPTSVMVLIGAAGVLILFFAGLALRKR